MLCPLQTLLLLTGIPPIVAILDIQSLTLFHNIIATDVNIAPAQCMRDLLLRQLAIKDIGAASWICHIRRLLHKYKLKTAFEIAQSLASKLQWKHSVKEAIYL